jgi:hypothetical protein
MSSNCAVVRPGSRSGLLDPTQCASVARGSVNLALPPEMRSCEGVIVDCEFSE